MGREGQYDLRLADNISTLITPDTDTEEDISLAEMQLSCSSHPTKLLKNASTKMLKLISVGVGLHGDKIEKCAIANIALMFRAVLASKMGFLNLGLEHWTTLGFLRAIAKPKYFSMCLTSPVWLNLHIDILNAPITNEQDVYKKIQCVRLLQATLVYWDGGDRSTSVDQLVQKLFECLGRTSLCCPNDLSLLQSSVDVKARVLITASHSGTIAEELISLLRKLHTLPLWNNSINSYLAQKLCIAAEMFGERTNEENRPTKAGATTDDVSYDDVNQSYVLAALTTIGGFDPRPRIGLRLANDNLFHNGTITSFTTKGKAVVSYCNATPNTYPDKKKVSISTASSSAEVVPFNLMRLPLNEMLLNALTVLLYGPGEWKGTNTSSTKTKIDVGLLRAQQIHLGALNATTGMLKHQSSLRKILRQRCPGLSTYSSNESISDQKDCGGNVNDLAAGSVSKTMQLQKKENFSETKKMSPENECDDRTGNDSGAVASADDRDVEDVADGDYDDEDAKNQINNELLIQNILTRATQTNPIKSNYSYAELALAALNLTQSLSSNFYAQSANVGSSSGGVLLAGQSKYATKPNPPPVQPTLIHGVPIYNDGVCFCTFKHYYYIINSKKKATNFTFSSL